MQGCLLDVDLTLYAWTLGCVDGNGKEVQERSATPTSLLTIKKCSISMLSCRSNLMIS